ncbi:preprotein translocase subunit YajC [Pseudonocardia sp. TMWB2A]|uniref:preprotein translocase subunit YajC n=1 Tax=Pseudonocardia sp. TMWB2A TaxID=687430 RepID=UPI00307CFF1D
MSISAILAQAAPAAADGAGSMGWIAFAPYVLIFVVMYFLLIRPQQQRVKAHQRKVNAISRNDQVVTAGGLVGKVVRVDDDYADVEIAQGVKVKVVKATIADVVSSATKPAND